MISSISRGSRSNLQRCLHTSRRQYKRCLSHLVPTRVTRCRARNLNKKVSRHIHTELPFKVIPHQFEIKEAASRFVKADKGRLFAPSSPKISNSITKQDDVEPLKKVFIPLFYFDADISSTDYNGEYGITRTRVIHTGKTTIIQTYTDWYPMSGTLRHKKYLPERDGLFVYAGFNWPSHLIEKAFSGFNITKRLKPFDPKQIDDTTFVDPFLKRSVLARKIALDRIEHLETQRAKNDIRKKSGYLQTSVHYTDIHYKEMNLHSCLLPAYILQYPNTPPRIMPALSRKTKITGSAPMSPYKTMLAGTIATASLSIFFPEIAIPARIAMIATSSAVTGLWTHYRLLIKSSWQKRQLKNEREDNESIAETKADKKRRMETEKFSSLKHTNLPGQIIDVDPLHFYELGLDPRSSVTEQIIKEAFLQEIKKSHPDLTHGSNDRTRKIITARNTLIGALRKKRTHSSGKRHYCTQLKPRIKQPPRSVYDHRARLLIDTVIREKNYKKALILVEKEEIHPDAHDKNENTLLAEAAKEGDLEAIRFAIDDLGASLDTSCDCPAHRTPLHYSSEMGDVKATRILLRKGANPNLINSYGETALDVAIQSGNTEVAELLEQYRGIRHTTIEGRDGFWNSIKRHLIGYRSDERTILLEESRSLERKKIKSIPSNKGDKKS